MKKLLISLLLVIVSITVTYSQSWMLHGMSKDEVLEYLVENGIDQDKITMDVLEDRGGIPASFYGYTSLNGKYLISHIFEGNICTSTTLFVDYKYLTQEIKSMDTHFRKIGEYWLLDTRYFTYRFDIIRRDEFFIVRIIVAQIHD
jgi:hypothetical protein